MYIVHAIFWEVYKRKMEKIRVVLIEDHDLTRIGLRTSLQQCKDIRLIAEAATGSEGLELLRSTSTDLAIIDIGLPEIDGIELTRALKQDLMGEDEVTPKVLILTLQDNEDAVLAAFAAGADSFCMKDITFDKLVEAVKTTHSGNSWIDPAIARIVLDQMERPSGDQETSTIEIQATSPEDQQLLESCPLTDRELEVLQLIVDGCSNSEIAERLFITVGTVKTHVRNILNKLCADDRTQAAVRALRSGLVG